MPTNELKSEVRQLTIRLTDDTHEILEEIAEENNRSLTGQLRHFIESYRSTQNRIAHLESLVSQSLCIDCHTPDEFN